MARHGMAWDGVMYCTVQYGNKYIYIYTQKYISVRSRGVTVHDGDIWEVLRVWRTRCQAIIITSSISTVPSPMLLGFAFPCFFFLAFFLASSSSYSIIWG